MSGLFDYQNLVQRLGISADRQGDLETAVRAQYGSDEMMFELRMIRTLRAIEEGATTLDEAISEFKRDPSRHSASPA